MGSVAVIIPIPKPQQMLTKITSFSPLQHPLQNSAKAMLRVSFSMQTGSWINPVSASARDLSRNVYMLYALPSKGFTRSATFTQTCRISSLPNGRPAIKSFTIALSFSKLSGVFSYIYGILVFSVIRFPQKSLAASAKQSISGFTPTK